MRKAFGSLQVRAALGSTAVVAIALVATGLALLQVLEADLRAKAIAEAAAEARLAAAALNAGAELDEVLLSSVPVRIEDSTGKVVASSRTGASVTGEPEYSDPVPSAMPTDNWTLVPVGDAALEWAAEEPAHLGTQEVKVRAAASFATERSAVRAVRWGMAVGLPPLLAIVALMSWLVARRTLRPVESIRRELEAITTSTDLARRVPVPESTDEISRLARTTNETLGALEASVEQQRRFVSDASHELRNPIASLRTQLEIGALHPELLDLAGAVDDTIRLEELASDLLLLARLDADESVPASTVRLDEVVIDQVRRQSAGKLPIVVSDLTEVEVMGSGSRLGRAIRNLMENAQRHATSQVEVELSREADLAILRVADDGPGVPPDQRERIFERFVRLDDARSRDGGGAGLGLAITRDIVHRHRGAVTVGPAAEGSGAIFEVRLPVRRPS